LRKIDSRAGTSHSTQQTERTPINTVPRIQIPWNGVQPDAL
jgi:hypothetical protein